jgi:hypothetical protein
MQTQALKQEEMVVMALLQLFLVLPCSMQVAVAAVLMLQVVD